MKIPPQRHCPFLKETGACLSHWGSAMINVLSICRFVRETLSCTRTHTHTCMQACSSCPVAATNTQRKCVQNILLAPSRHHRHAFLSFFFSALLPVPVPHLVNRDTSCSEGLVAMETISDSPICKNMLMEKLIVGVLGKNMKKWGVWGRLGWVWAGHPPIFMF